MPVKVPIKVLVISDSFFVRSTLAHMLRDAGMKAFTADSYKETMEIMPVKPDVILLSIDMHGISSLDILL